MLDRDTLAARVRTAIAEAGVRQQEVAAAVGIGPSSLSRALSGQRDFKSLELALVAEFLGVSTEVLLSDAVQVPVPVSLAARVQPGRSPAFAEAVARVDEIVGLDRLLAELGYASRSEVPLPVPSASSSSREGEELASRVRRLLGMGDEDLPGELDDLAKVLEGRFGVDVAFEPLPAGLDGLSVACDGFALAMVSSRLPATRQRYTLAHELGHLAAGDAQELLVDENVLGGRSAEETRANAFAAAFLMPAAALRAAVTPGYASEERVAELLGRYRVSLDALAFRLHNVGAVDAAGRDRVRALSSSRIALRAGRAADLQARNDRRVPEGLLGRAIEAHAKGHLGVRPLASLLGIDAEQLLDELSPGPRPGGTAGEPEPVL
jgi:Zn-dependent peptidase ImmA (M78 family)/transcriptional regulator with XRE-family HTH domain